MKTDLQIIPGVGKSMAEHLKALGILCVEDLKGRTRRSCTGWTRPVFPEKSWTAAASMSTAWRWPLPREGRIRRKSKNGGVIRTERTPGGSFRRAFHAGGYF